MRYMLRFLWNATRGHRLTPWRSPYLLWRVETYCGVKMQQIGFLEFWEFMWRERSNLWRFLKWTAEMEQLPDPAGVDLEAIWDQEWERNLLDTAMARVKQQVNPKQFQMFNFYVLKEWPVGEVAKALGVTVAQVYLAKHRVSGLVKKELKQLQTKLV